MFVWEIYNCEILFIDVCVKNNPQYYCYYASGIVVRILERSGLKTAYLIPEPSQVFLMHRASSYLRGGAFQTKDVLSIVFTVVISNNLQYDLGVSSSVLSQLPVEVRTAEDISLFLSS